MIIAGELFFKLLNSNSYLGVVREIRVVSAFIDIWSASNKGPFKFETVGETHINRNVYGKCMGSQFIA